MGVLFKSNCHILVSDLLCYAHRVSAVGNGNTDVSMAELVRVKVLDTILLTEPMKVSGWALRVDGFDVKLLDEYVHYFNYERPAAALGYKSPVQYKTELGFL